MVKGPAVNASGPRTSGAQSAGRPSAAPGAPPGSLNASSLQQAIAAAVAAAMAPVLAQMDGMRQEIEELRFCDLETATDYGSEMNDGPEEPASGDAQDGATPVATVAAPAEEAATAAAGIGPRARKKLKIVRKGKTAGAA